LIEIIEAFFEPASRATQYQGPSYQQLSSTRRYRLILLTSLIGLRISTLRLSVYPLRDGEPRFLTLDAFKLYINKGRKTKPNELVKKKEKCLKEEKLQQDLRDELGRLKVTLSLIPGGCTGYVQVLDVLINKLIKAYIVEYEDEWIKENFEAWEAGKWSVGDRRVLLTY
jgi:hypothetical protein